MPDESLDRYAFKLIERIINHITFEDKKEIHKSEDFIIRQKQAAHEDAYHKTIFVENEENYVIKNIKWPKISEFSEKLGSDKIEEFMKNTWEYDECWLFCIDFIEKIEKEFTTLYNYRARWSIPTRRKPIPRFTASVFFSFDVSKIKPKDNEVNVYYVFETQKLIHKPGLSRFRQQWLNDIIELKEALLKNCNF